MLMHWLLESSDIQVYFLHRTEVGYPTFAKLIRLHGALVEHLQRKAHDVLTRQCSFKAWHTYNPRPHSVLGAGNKAPWAGNKAPWAA